MWSYKLPAICEAQRQEIFRLITAFTQDKYNHKCTYLICGANNLGWPDPSFLLLEELKNNCSIIEPISKQNKIAKKRLESIGFTLLDDKKFNTKETFYESHEVALSAKSVKQKLFIGNHSNNSNSSLISNTNDFQEYEIVEGLEFKDFMAISNFSYFEFIHLDLEGLDHLIIQQITEYYSESNLPLIIEWENNKLTSIEDGDKAIKNLTEIGYKLFHLNFLYPYALYDIIAIHESIIPIVNSCLSPIPEVLKSDFNLNPGLEIKISKLQLEQKIKRRK